LHGVFELPQVQYFVVCLLLAHVVTAAHVVPSHTLPFTHPPAADVPHVHDNVVNAFLVQFKTALHVLVFKLQTLPFGHAKFPQLQAIVVYAVSVQPFTTRQF